jgi:hypothetical protein
MDAAIVVAPENKINPTFVDGDTYFQAAKSQRERPSLAELEQWRRIIREHFRVELADPKLSHGSGVIHAFAGCSGDKPREANE